MKKIIKNKYFFIILVMILGFATYSYIQGNAVTAEEGPTTSESIVARGNIVIGFTGDGVAEIPVVNVDFDINGTLKEIYVSEGDKVTEGQLLAKLKDEEYLNKLKTSEITYKQALTNLELKKENEVLSLLSEKEKLDNYKSSLEKIKAEYQPMVENPDLYPSQDITFKKLDLDSAQTAYDNQLKRYNTLKNSNKSIEVEKANVESKKINLEIAEDDFNSTSLISPISATILNIAYKEGEIISSPSNSSSQTSNTTNFIILSDSDKVEVTVPVSELDLDMVEKEQTVEVVFEAFEGITYTGKVSNIKSLPDIDNNGVVTYDVTILLEGDTERIKSGMTCEATFIMRQEKNVLTIPNKAVYIFEGTQYVDVKNDQGSPEQRAIKTGLTDGKNSSVIEGLIAGETLVITKGN
ncbi:MAG: efflux RND transporter periplasmic adaptor subunit [Firmicutes bacterium]|nr:efflux RND transporter periplasmic adaptor subunit [Bacillota bacterium]